MATIPVTTTAPFGLGSLHWAILRANQSPGPDTIRFQVPINPLPGQPTDVLFPPPPGGYPVITGKVTIDGFTQPLSKPNTSTNPAVNNTQWGIVLVSAERGPMLTIGPGGSGSEIRGLGFISTSRAGLTDPSGLLINHANGVRVDGDGFAAIEDGGLTPAIRIVGGSQNSIGGNVAQVPALQNVMNSYSIGLEVNGTLSAPAQNNAIFGNIVGGQTSAKGPLNVGMVFQPGADNNTIVGNILIANKVPIFDAGRGNLQDGNVIVPPV